MAKLSSNRIPWRYTADNGTVYRVAAMKAVTDQAKLGGAAAQAGDPPKPGWLKMRRITLIDATHGTSRTVPVYSSTAPILQPDATVNLNTSWLAEGVYTEDSAEFTNDVSSQDMVMIIQEKHSRKSPVVKFGNA